MSIRTSLPPPQQIYPPKSISRSSLKLVDFWGIPPEQRHPILTEAICESHPWHFQRNKSYRRTLSGRGVGERIQESDFSRLIRPTAQTFKSYIELLDTPFPNDQPIAFLKWLDNQLSIDLPADRFPQFRTRYRTLESFLCAIEQMFADLHLEISTSSGTSGRSTIMVRDEDAIQLTVDSFHLSFQRYLGMRADHRAIFIMPRETRIAMVRMARFSVRKVGLPPDQTHFMIPFPAEPDRVRVRTGRIYRPGLSGVVERRALHPFMNTMNDRIITPLAIRKTVNLIKRAERSGEKILLFAGWIHLHAVALDLQARGETIRLAPGSVVGTGGGMKELYPFNPQQIRADVGAALIDHAGKPVQILDTYGMAEANWAAMQCGEGNYHLPPWIYVMTLDQDHKIVEGSDATGLLAFFDPFAGGKLFPAFFRTADQVRLINSTPAYDPAMDCPCGEHGSYLHADSIQRVDLMDEAGCAAQV